MNHVIKDRIDTSSVVAETVYSNDITIALSGVSSIPRLNFVKEPSLEPESNTKAVYGVVRWVKNNASNEDVKFYMQCDDDGYKLYTIEDGKTFKESSSIILTMKGNFGIGDHAPGERLSVNGNAKIKGFVQFGHFTREERNQLAISNGAVIYNTSDNRFQGYQNNKWINLDDGSDA
jgi:hypothetical protein